MKTAAIILAASAALANAQVTFNETDGKYHCAKPNAVYCSSDSLTSNIIIRCDANGLGQPGNCNDNLDGEPPVGLNYAPCWQTSNTSGDAACSKNCVVYGGSGNANGTFTLPAALCTPSYTATSSGASSTATASASSSVSTVVTVSTTSTGTAPPTTITTLATLTTSYCPSSLSTGASSGIVPPAGNGTCTSCGGSGSGSGATATGSGSATATPVGPTKTTSQPSSVATAGAAANKVGGALAAVGLFAVALL